MIKCTTWYKLWIRWIINSPLLHIDGHLTLFWTDNRLLLSMFMIHGYRILIIASFIILGDQFFKSEFHITKMHISRIIPCHLAGRQDETRVRSRLNYFVCWYQHTPNVHTKFHVVIWNINKDMKDIDMNSWIEIYSILFAGSVI